MEADEVGFVFVSGIEVSQWQLNAKQFSYLYRIKIKIKIYLGMRYALFALLLCFHSAFGQSDSTVYLKELAWTIKLAPGFKVIDTATLNAESRARESEIHWIKKHTGPNYHKVIFWARDNAGEVIYVDCIDSVRRRHNLKSGMSVRMVNRRIA